MLMPVRSAVRRYPTTADESQVTVSCKSSCAYMLATPKYTSLFFSSLFKGRIKSAYFVYPSNLLNVPSQNSMRTESMPLKLSVLRSAVHYSGLVIVLPDAAHELRVLSQVQPVDTHQKQELGMTCAVTRALCIITTPRAERAIIFLIFIDRY